MTSHRCPSELRHALVRNGGTATSEYAGDVDGSRRTTHFNTWTRGVVASSQGGRRPRRR